MAELDLNALLKDTIDVKKDIDGKPQVWKLNDNIPALTMFAVMHIGTTERRRPALEASDGENITPDDEDAYWEKLRTWQIGLEQEVLHAAGECFRHTFPEMTDERLAELFTHDERYAVVMRFFRSRTSPSSDDSPGTTSALSAPTSDSDDQTAEARTQKKTKGDPSQSSEA